MCERRMREDTEEKLKEMGKWGTLRENREKEKDKV